MVQKSSPRTRHNPTEIRQIRGYPTSLKLFRMPASKYWYVRMYISGGPSSGVKKSTRCEKLSDAEDFAINWYEERLLEKREFKERGANTFAVFAKKFQEQQKRLIRRGELEPDMLYQDDLRLEKDLLPYLGTKFIKQVDYNLIDEFIDELHNDRNLAQSTLKKYVILVRKVLKEAERDGVIDYIPTLPVVKRVDNPRPWFSPEEYSKLLSACRDLRDNPPPDTDFSWEELYDFIVFMVHSFLRPSEWKFLQNRHIRFIQDDGIEQLVISVPNPKTKKASGSLDSTTTEVAADIYRKRILKRNDDQNAYLFFDYLRNRENTAPDTISRKFRYLCEHAKLDRDAYGQRHTTYSLRHSALCFQILKTGGNDLFGLARNARTSVMMLENFYLRHLSPQLPEFTKQLRTKRTLESANP
jgi:hypothetical protein